MRECVPEKLTIRNRAGRDTGQSTKQQKNRLGSIWFLSLLFLFVGFGM